MCNILYPLSQQIVVERTQSKLYHTFSEFQIFKISMHLLISTLFYVIKNALLCSCMRNCKTSYFFWARLIKICSLTVVGVGVVDVTFSHFHHLQNHWANFNPLGTKNHWVKGIQFFFLQINKNALYEMKMKFLGSVLRLCKNKFVEIMALGGRM